MMISSLAKQLHKLGVNKFQMIYRIWNLQKMIISKAQELGGSSNKEMLNKFVEIIGVKNPNSCEDKDKLIKLMKELEVTE